MSRSIQKSLLLLRLWHNFASGRHFSVYIIYAMSGRVIEESNNAWRLFLLRRRSRRSHVYGGGIGIAVVIVVGIDGCRVCVRGIRSGRVRCTSKQLVSSIGRVRCGRLWLLLLLLLLLLLRRVL